MSEFIQKIFWEIFPRGYKSWNRYLSWSFSQSYIGRPLYYLVILFLLILFPITRLELRIRSTLAKRKSKEVGR